MSLATLQRQLQAAITADGAPPPLRGHLGGLAVYRHAWRARLVEALRTNYPVLHRVLGDAAFAALADDYMAAHPSRRRSIRWFGHRLPAFVAAHIERLPHPSLADLTRFEWAICLAFDAADHPPLGFETLAATGAQAWPALRFSLQPGAALLALSWSVAPVWRALSEAEDANTPVPPPEPLAHHVLVWRRGLTPAWRSLPPLEARLLEAIAAGACFGQLCEHALARVGEADAAATVLGYLQQWVADEVLADGDVPAI
jgi:hypothetical protein